MVVLLTNTVYSGWSIAQPKPRFRGNLLFKSCLVNKIIFDKFWIFNHIKEFRKEGDHFFPVSSGEVTKIINQIIDIFLLFSECIQHNLQLRHCARKTAVYPLCD